MDSKGGRAKDDIWATEQEASSQKYTLNKSPLCPVYQIHIQRAQEITIYKVQI